MLTDVYQAVDQRSSVRAFTDRAVDRATIDRVLRAASRTPSGGNLQPWRLWVLTGEPLARVKHLFGERVAGRDTPDSPEYAMATSYRQPDLPANSVRMERAPIEETVSLPGPPWTVFGWR